MGRKTTSEIRGLHRKTLDKTQKSGFVLPVKRLLARDCGDMAMLPAVVVQNELHSGSLQLYVEVPDIAERFYAVILQR